MLQTTLCHLACHPVATQRWHQRKNLEIGSVSADVHALCLSAVAWPNAQQPQTGFHKLWLNGASFSLFCIR